MKRGAKVLFSIVFLVILMGSFAAAADVAYILNNERRVKAEITGVFDELGLSYELIKDKDVLSVNLNNYKLVFVDDAILRKTKTIPVYNYPSVIMNKNYGGEWGLTDYDGISQLSATYPLQVRLVDNGVRQVYTVAKAGSVNIPYYFLDDNNKANMTSIARTYTGNTYSFGDVVATAQAGTHLINGKISGAKICFYGIAKTKYWTNDARELFIDCVNSVLVVCEQDSDCDDSDAYTQDVCVNPGTIQSRCEHEPIACLNNDECGIDRFVGNVFCDGVSGNEVWRHFLDFTCNNPNTTASYCSNITTAVFNESCIYGCFNGACLNDNAAPVIELIFPPDKTNITNPNVNFVYDVRDDSAISNCSLIINDNKVRINNSIFDVTNSFSYTLSTGSHFWRVTCDDEFGNTGISEIREINVGSITCSQDSDCGLDGFIGNLFCNGASGNDVFRNYIEWTCINPGTFESDCNQQVEQRFIESCQDICVNGACANITCYNDSDCDDENNSTIDYCNNPGTVESYCTHQNIACFQDSDCGSNRFIGSLYCSGDDIYRDFMNFSCNFPGQVNSYCSNNRTGNLIQECEFACANGNCVRCNDNIDCDDSDTSTQDVCWFSGTTESYCTHEHIECFEDLDCGEDSFVGSLYCLSDDVYQDYREFSCANPNTPGAYCNAGNTPILIENCLFGCEAGRCLAGIHDVALVDFSNAINKIRLEYQNGTDILENELRCNEKYKIGVTAENLGNFFENVTFSGSIGSLLFSHNPIDNFSPGDSSLKTKTVNFSLNPGAYNINIQAIIPVDDVPANNLASRGISIICPDCISGSQESRQCGLTDTGVCEYGEETRTCVNGEWDNWGSCTGAIYPAQEDCDNGLDDDCDGYIDNADNDCIECVYDLYCGSVSFINNYCKGSEKWSNYSVPRCLSGSCEVEYQQQFVENCSAGCENGACRQENKTILYSVKSGMISDWCQQGISFEDIMNGATDHNNAHYLGGTYGTGPVPCDYRHYEQFNLSSIPANAVITKATLRKWRLPNFDNWNKMYEGYVKVKRVTSSWNEGDDWILRRNYPNTTSAGEHYIPATNAGAYVADVTSIVQAWKSGSINYGFEFSKYKNYDSGARGFFRNAGIDFKPSLEIEYVV